MIIFETFLRSPIKSATWFDIHLNRGYEIIIINYEICIISEFNSNRSMLSLIVYWLLLWFICIPIPSTSLFSDALQQSTFHSVMLLCYNISIQKDFST